MPVLRNASLKFFSSLCLSLGLTSTWGVLLASAKEPVKVASNLESVQAENEIAKAFKNSSENPQDAETKLLSLLSQLEASSPNDPQIDNCLDRLISVYEGHEQIEYAHSCWQHRIRVARQFQHSSYIDLLQKYLWFLNRYKKYEEVPVIADEYYEVAMLPDQTLKPSELP